MKKRATLYHNPKAGEKDHSKKKLSVLLEKHGYRPSYRSTKGKSWREELPGEGELVVLAGCDGTVRKIARHLLDRRVAIALLPMGTANNIAKTLGIAGSPSEILSKLDASQKKKFDVGRIYGLKKIDFFLEGVGYGVFPRLMKEMEKRKDELSEVPEENLKLALSVLHDIILQSKARFCKINIDGADYSGEFLLAEVMNAQSIGPNLNLAPFADPGDGSFDVILIAERQREEFASYVHNKLHGVDQPPVFNILKAKNLDIYWEGKLLHVDDEIIQLKESTEIRIKLQEGVLEFLVPADNA